ncbi:uridine kinase [Metschnikowia bicuspidata var. bicuspidata NRRL YB-4993]|uniref:Uridine kinase n=1 Tax=Metschnikowia bicuspidata var. bicuspidata NRRL YB-4993 TaxID=869754 RepID=A0A1A0H7W5_9ASCO|nr:uridine kinase [Metschnikowia bicuspidata var. bicuspidata NRRL YB-4993]OBA20189.1 uridine kinase [Metschnikowia bicuspidata var. bicuspidata NRRL YB-4993]
MSPKAKTHLIRIAPDEQRQASFFTSIKDLKPHSSESSLSADRESQAQLSYDTYVPPWTEPYVIGVAGFSGSGKTSISQQIILELNTPWTVLLLFDNFYKPLSAEESAQAFACNYDFDTPKAIDMDLVVEKLTLLKQGHKTEIPVYSFSHHNRTEKHITIYGANVIIVEGIYALYDQRLLDLMDIKVFVDTDLDVCLARRLTRDILYRGRDLAGALQQWETSVKPNATGSVYPTIRNADLVIPRGLDNTRAIDLMIKHIQKQLALKSAAHLDRLKALGHGVSFDVSRRANLKILPATNHTAGIHSMLFDVHTDRTDFIFYFDRISHLLVEAALDTLHHYTPKTVACHNGNTFKGLVQSLELAAVSIVRSGDCFMNGVRKTFPAIPTGKLLIQSDSMTGEPQLHYENLPKSSEGSVYFLLDAQIISGAGAVMAIQVLIDHKVEQRNIVLISYLLTEIAVKRIFNVFPEVTIVVGKLSNTDTPDRSYNPEGFKDADWPFRTRFVDLLYFGTT